MGLDGVWYNELKSKMVLKVQGKQLVGTYQTAVGDADGEYVVLGSFDPAADPEGQTVGWVVAWANDKKNSHSLTVWSGEYQVLNKVEMITTEWLLTRETDASDDWQSTLIGHDVFKRELPTDEVFQIRLKSRAWAYPTKRP